MRQSKTTHTSVENDVRIAYPVAIDHDCAMRRGFDNHD
jgi:hypothetical protein